MNNSLFNLLFHSKSSLYVNKRNGIDWHYRFNLIGRVISWIKDRKGTKLNTAIQKVFDNFKQSIEDNKPIEWKFKGKIYTKIDITNQLKNNKRFSDGQHAQLITLLEAETNKPKDKEKQEEPEIENSPPASLPVSPAIILNNEPIPVEPVIIPKPLVIPSIETPGVNPLQAQTAQTAVRAQTLANATLLKRKQVPADFLTAIDTIVKNTDPFQPNLAILQFFLTDYVGGGEGNQLINAVTFFQHYLTLYCKACPSDHRTNQIQQQLQAFYVPASTSTLTEIEDELLSRLKKERYVSFAGGYAHPDSGHALFYELALDTMDQVTLQITNSGEGLEYHPPYLANEQTAERHYFYRTLILPKTTLLELKDSQYLQLILSFRRPRAPIEQLKEHLVLATAQPSIEHLYRLLMQSWPGRGIIQATNPGGQQRANSCAVQSLVKWLKGQYKEGPEDYLTLNLWIKIQSLHDALHRSTPLPSNFLKDAMRKIGNHLSKMEQTKLLTEELFASWQEIAALAAERILIESQREQAEIKSISLSFKEGIDLTKAQPLTIIKKEKKAKVIDDQLFIYAHHLPGELVDYSLAEPLSQFFIASDLDETVYRLNFLKGLPNADQFNFERDVASSLGLTPLEAASIDNQKRRQFFTTLAQLTQKFFYAPNKGQSLHLPDLFLADLFNGWLIVYREAQRDTKISQAVFLEWMEGLIILLEAYKDEYQFATVESKRRFNLVFETCQREKNRLSSEVKEEDKGANLWHLYDPRKNIAHWSLFGCQEGDTIRQLSQLPAMAKFAYQVALQNPEYYDFLKYKYSPVAENCLAFGLRLDGIPYYQDLRTALAYFYILGERHLFISSPHKVLPEERIENTIVIPAAGVRITHHFDLVLNSSYPININQDKERHYPEHHLPKVQEQYQFYKDPNRRTLQVYTKKERVYPFFTLVEEQEFLTFVQLEPYTKLTEGLKFFEKRLDQLNHTAYQAAFEQLLWGGEDNLIEWLDRKTVASQESLPLLFNFIQQSFSTLLSSRNYSKKSATFLFHVQLKLYVLSEQFAANQQPIHYLNLVENFNVLIDLGKKNASLVLALSHAVFGALPIIESSRELSKNKQFLVLVAASLLLECQQGIKGVSGNYDKITLNYGYQSFKKMLQCSNATFIWAKALDLLAFSYKSPLKWEKDRLEVGSCSFNFLNREIENSLEESYRDDQVILIPEKIKNSLEYSTVFGKQVIFAKFSKEGKRESYLFKNKNQTYQIDSTSFSINLFKIKNDQTYHLLSSVKLASFPLLKRFEMTHHVWQQGDILYLENKKSGLIEMKLIGQTVQRLKKEEWTGEILGKLEHVANPLYQLLIGIAKEDDIVIWLNAKQHINCINLTKLNLTLLPVEKQNLLTLACKEHPGFYIAKNQFLAYFPHFQNLFILENEQGQRKVWIPLEQITAQKHLPYQQTAVSIEEHSNRTNYLTFDLAAGQLFPAYSKQNLLPTLFFFYLSLKTKQYSQALKMIKESEFIYTRRELNQEEERVLQWIFDMYESNSKNIDQHPHAAALRIQLLAWMAHQERKGQNIIVSHYSRDHFKKDWQVYHDLKDHLGIYRLSKKKEKTLSSFYKPNAFIQKFLPDAHNFKSYPSFNFLWKIRKQILDNVINLLPLTSFSAPSEEFILNFLNYYRIATQKDATQLPLLKRLLATVTTDTDSSIQACAWLLNVAIQAEQTPTLAKMISLFSLSEEKTFNIEFENIYRPINEQLHYINFNTQEWCLGIPEIYGINSNQRKIQALESKKISLVPALLTHNKAKLNISLHLEEIKEQLVVDDHSIIVESQPLLAAERQAAEAIQSWTKGQMQVAKQQQDPLTAAEFQRLSKGTDLYLKELDNKTTAFLLRQDQPQIADVLKQYTLAIAQQEQELKVLKNKILTLANETHQERSFILELQQDLRFKFEMETLLIALGRQDFQAIRHSNPTLTDSEIQQLINLVGQYALLKTHVQKKQRCRQALQTYQDLLHVNSEPVALELAAQSYVAQSQATRAYAINALPQLLVFEALSHILLRQEQVEALQLLNQKGWILFEARTGFGKSTALERLWLLLTAKEDTLAIMIAPATLFEQQEAGLQQFLQQAYRLFGYRLDFSRESPSMAEDIQTILKDLKRAQRKRQPVFMSDQTAHNLLVLKPKELAAQKSNPKALAALLELKQYVKQKAVLFIDEPHKVLDDSQESNYSIGMNQFFKPERLVLSAHLYQAFFKVIDQRYRVECWQTTASKQLPLLTEKIYQQLLPELVKAILKQTTLAIDDQAKAYLLGQLDSQDQIQYEQQLQTLEPKLLANQIRILHDQLHHYLFQTLSQNANEHYGTLDLAQQRIAIPLEDARHPKEGNEYCSPDQILNFTIQLNMRTPFSLDYVQRFFEQLAQEASTEMEKKERDLKETRGYQQFLLLTKLLGPQAPKSLLNLKPADLEHFLVHLEQNIPLRLQFIALSVLPHLRRYEEKIVSTPHLLVACFKEVVGASGTLSLQNLPSQFEIVQDELAMARTVITMQRKYAQAEPIYECATEESSEIIKLLPQAAKASGLTHPSVLIEIGAVLRDYPALLQVAKELLIQFPHFKGVATFDQQGLPIVLKQGMKKFIPYALAHLPESQLFWLYAQKDTTGTDRQLAPTAQALVFINEHNDLSALVQGIGRLRGIHLGQTARLLLTKNAALSIKHCLAKEPDTALSYLDLLEYAVKKLALNKGQHNFPSLDLKGQAILENLFWQESSKGTPQEFAQNFNRLRHLFVEDTSDQPLQQASLQAHLSSIDQGLDKLKGKFMQRLTQIQTALTGQPLAQHYQVESLLAEWERAKEQMLYPKEVKLNDTTQHTSIASAETQTTATQQTTQQQLLNLQAEEQEEKQVETQSTQLASSLANLSGKQFLPHSNQITFHPLKEAFQHPKLQKFISLFSDQLSISENALVTIHGDSLKTPGWINGYMKPLHYVLIEYQGAKLTQFNICDQLEAAQLCQQKRTKGTLWLINQGVMASFDGKTTDKLKADPNLALLELQVKLLDGDLDFTEQQETLLKTWLTADKKPLLKQFIQDILLPLHPQLLTSLAYQSLIAC